MKAKNEEVNLSKRPPFSRISSKNILTPPIPHL